MNFILHIKCTEQQEFNYSNPILDTLKKEIKADFFDLDNFSDSYLIEQALVALGKAEKNCVLIELLPESNTKPFLKIATWLADHPEKNRVFVNGKDEWISKLLFPSEGFSYHNKTAKEQLECIEKFLL